MKTVYICYPYDDNPEQRIKELREALPKFLSLEVIPIVPHFMFQEFEKWFGKQYARKCCFKLLEKADELWLIAHFKSPGMQLELELAERLGKPIRKRWLEEAVKKGPVV